MKTIIKLFATLILLINFIGCQKDAPQELSSINNGKETGIDIPIHYKDYSNIEKNQFIGDKHRVIEHLDPSESPNYTSMKEVQTTSRSRGVEGINFGYSVHSTTVNQGNSISRNFGHEYDDRVYKLEVNQTSEIEITLTNLRTDLDVYLAEIYVDAYGRELVGDLLADSELSSTQNEKISVTVDAGNYFIIVDSWRTPGTFTLTARDKTTHPPNYFCEDYENLTATTNPGHGVANQLNTWTKWDSSAGDGRVLYEDRRYDNKVVKMDWGRFYYQDVVRTLIGLPITKGLYTMKFKMFVPYGHSAGFVSEKVIATGSGKSKTGFKITVGEDGTLTFYQNGREQRSRYNLPQDQWIDINLIFDMTYNTIYAVIDHAVIVYFNASAPRYKGNVYLKSIAGINFYTTHSNMKYNIDDVCVKEIEPGYEQPIVQNISDAYQEVVSFLDENQTTRINN